LLVRRGGGYFWYESRRVGGRVRRGYVCSGEEALAASRRRDEERLIRRAERDEALLEEQRHEQALAGLEEFAALLDSATIAVLEGLGYHRHARGEWRLKRHGSHEAQRVHGRTEADSREGGEG
jgi:hypothetical protein